MTPDTRIAIAKAIAEISALSTQEFREKLSIYRTAPLALSLSALSEFAEQVAQCIETSFVFEGSHPQSASPLEAWYDDIIEQLAANDDYYLLAA